MNRLRVRPSLVIAVLVAASVVASVVDSEAQNSGRYASSGTSKAFSAGKDNLVMAFEEFGVTEADGGKDPWHNTAWRCVGTGHFTKEIGQFTGYCIGQHPSGDQAVLDFKSAQHHLGDPKVEGTYNCLGGTGRFAAIRGSGTYVSFGGQTRPPADGVYVNYNRFQDNCVTQ
jgi:hypothetical protein